MAIPFACEDCGQRYQVEDGLGGRRLKCKKCERILTIPSLAVKSPATSTDESFGALRPSAFAKPAPATYSLDEAIDVGSAPSPYSLDHGYAAPRASSRPKKYKHEDFEEYELASIWHRFLAYLLDGVIIMLLLIGVLIVCLALGFALSTAANNPVPLVLMFVLAYLSMLVLPILYFARQESSSEQATYGKRALHLIVVDVDGNPISFGRSLGRSLAKTFLSSTLYIGFFFAFFNADKQTVHDLIAGTLVIYDPDR